MAGTDGVVLSRGGHSCVVLARGGHYWFVLSRSGTADSCWLEASTDGVVLFCCGHS